MLSSGEYAVHEKIEALDVINIDMDLFKQITLHKPNMFFFITPFKPYPLILIPF